MSDKHSHSRKRTYFNSPKKQPLVRKMIFDSHQGNAPSSCYELRPIHEYQSCSEEIIYDPKSSSLKQISEFEKHSPHHQIDRMIYDSNGQNHSVSHPETFFMSAQKQHPLSEQDDQKSSPVQENSSSFKRDTPINEEQIKKYEQRVKMFQIIQQVPAQKNESNFNKGVKICRMSSLNEIQSEKQQTNKGKRLSRVQNIYKTNQKQDNQKQKQQEEERIYDQNEESYKFVTPVKMNKRKNNFVSLYPKQLQLDLYQAFQQESKHSSSSYVPPARSSSKKSVKVKLQEGVLIQKQSHQVKYATPQKRMNFNQMNEIKLESTQKAHTSNRHAVQKKFTQNPQFQLINEYYELMSYSTLIEQMITTYDKSPLFQNGIDFQSETESSDEQDENNSNSENQRSIKQLLLQGIKNPLKLQQNLNQVKIQDGVMPDEKQLHSNNKMSNHLFQSSQAINNKQTLSWLQKLRIDQAPQKQKKTILKQIKFEKTKTYFHYYEPIEQLKPYIKKMSVDQKQLFLEFKNQLKQIKEIMSYYDKKKVKKGEKQHVCKVCGQEFDNGRQLGGHMSRKHPGKALEYGFKRELQKVKQIEKNRRRYFRDMKEGVVIKIEYQEEQAAYAVQKPIAIGHQVMQEQNN